MLPVLNSPKYRIGWASESGSRDLGSRKKLIPDPDPGVKEHRIPDPAHNTDFSISASKSILNWGLLETRVTLLRRAVNGGV